MSDDPRSGADTPRDPWGNPLPPDDRPPADPRPDDFPPPYPGAAPDGGAPDANPAWPGGRGEGAPGANPAWPGRQGDSAPDAPRAPGASGDAPVGGSPGWSAPPPNAGGGQPPTSPQTWGAPPQGWQGPPGQAGWTPHPWAAPRTEGMAVGGFVCSIVGILICGIILEPVAIALGFAARKRIRESGGALKGEGLATAAIVIGIIGVVLTILGIVVIMANPDIMDELFDTSST